MKSTKFWIILIAFLFLISCAAAVAVFFYHGTGTVVGVYQNGELIRQINLDTVTMPYTFRVENDRGGYNTVTVEQGRICVSDASCPDHVCVQTGWISDGAIPIVCLPNQLVIQSEGEHSGGVDVAVQ